MARRVRAEKCCLQFCIFRFELLLRTPHIITFHVLIQLQRHADITDLDGLKVALDDHVARLHVAVQQLLFIVKIL